MKIRWIVNVFLVCSSLLFSGTASGADPSTKIQGLLGKNDACLVASPAGELLVAINIDKKLVPASILKIFTVLTAYHFLGVEHRYKTDVYSDTTGNIKLKGFGDPLLISEELATMAATVQQVLGPQSVTHRDLILDNSYFNAPLSIPGVTDSLNPYDAPNGALCANFNTVSFQKNNSGTFISAEPQTPLLPSVLSRIRAAKLKKGRIVLTNNNEEATVYFGELFRFFLSQRGISTTGSVKIGKINTETDQLLLSYTSSFSMNDIVSSLMAYSNNFIANQLLITAGAKAYGPPGTIAKGVRAALAYGEKQLGLTGTCIVEGSGISRKNRISARAMFRVLQAFMPHHELMRQTDREYYKTGTLNGVSTRAGYLKRTDGTLHPFVVMINSTSGKMDRVLKTLHATIYFR